MIFLFSKCYMECKVDDYPYLNNFADEVIPAINAVIAEKIRLLFEKILNKCLGLSLYLQYNS